MRLIKTLCPFCGAGCSLYAKVDNNKVVDIVEDKKDPISKGKPCIKGLSSYKILDAEDRIKKPLIRKNNKLFEANWNEAYRYVYENLKNLERNEIAFYISKGSDEDGYLLQKFAKDVFETTNIDSCARLCHGASSYAFFETFGIKRMPAKINDIEKADCILIIGSNPMYNYPVVYDKIKRSRAKTICVAPFKEGTGENVDVFLKIESGTDIVLLNYFLRSLRTVIPLNIRRCVERYSLKKVKEICNLNINDVKKAVGLIRRSKNFFLMYGMGLTQHVYSVNNIFSALNLVLAKNGVIISMRGRANIQGVVDMGCRPTGGGDTIISSVFYRPVKALYIVDSNPAQSLPNLNRAHKELRKMFIVLHTNFPTLTMKFADVVFPCSLWLERNGLYTNAESRVRFFNKAINGYGKDNWVIIKELARYFRTYYNYKNIFDIWKDIKKDVNGYDKLDVRKVKNKGYFVNDNIKFKRYHIVNYKGREGLRSKEYPFIVTTARDMHQFCTGEISSRIKELNDKSELYCLVNRKDAKRIKIRNGDIIKVISKVGRIKVKAKIGDVDEKLVVLPYHYEKCLVNKLVPLEISPLVEEPNYKRVAVRIEKN